MRHAVAALVFVCVVTGGGAHADVSHPDPSADPSPSGATPKLRLTVALQRFEFGDYPGVIRELEVLIEQGGVAVLPRADRLEALRAYGIACAMTERTTAAEGAFLLLLEADPSARLDPRFVRPEAVAIFDAVRTRHREELLAVYKRGRGRRYAVLNLLPPAGQLQNREYKKGYALLGVELALLALDVTSGSLLHRWSGPHQDFPHHEADARALRPVNWASFGALIAVAVYGIVDGFVVGHRRAREERQVEGQLRSAASPQRPFAARLAEHLILSGEAGSLGVHF